MDTLAFSTTMAGAAFAAGFLGSLTGLGGGVVIVPLLTIVFGADIHYAIGTSMVSVIATSSGAAAAYVKEGFTNLRIGMLLEVATTFGALVGAWLVGIIPANVIAVIFGLVLIQSAYLASRPRSDRATENLPPDRLATHLKLDSSFPTERGEVRYHVYRVPGGFALMWVAGVLSGLLGIGSGAVKVLAMDRIMRIPFKVSTTTSNFMIGVTAAASAGIYLRRGFIQPTLAMPVMLGVLAGSLLGARVLFGARSRVLRLAFSFAILVLGIEMAVTGLHL